MTYLIAGGVGALAVIAFFVWVIRRNKKYGRLEEEHERLVDYSETVGEINDMERAIDEEAKPDFGDVDSARDYLSGGMRGEDGNKR